MLLFRSEEHIDRWCKSWDLPRGATLSPRQTWKLSAYVDVTNVYAHARVLGYSYNYDYSERTPIEDLPIVPAIGVRGSF